MAKWHGNIGFVEEVEVEPGIHDQRSVVRQYNGELVRNSSKFQTSGGVNDNINVSTELSIVSDPYANANFLRMRYAEMYGAKWKINNVEVKYPRLILSIGGVYNGE